MRLHQHHMHIGVPRNYICWRGAAIDVGDLFQRCTIVSEIPSLLSRIERQREHGDARPRAGAEAAMAPASGRIDWHAVMTPAERLPCPPRMDGIATLRKETVSCGVSDGTRHPSVSRNIRRRDSMRTYEWLSRTEDCGVGSYDGQHGLVPTRLRAGHYKGARVKAWCLLIHAEASLSLSLGGADCLCPRSMSETSGRTDWHAVVTPEHLMTCQAISARAHLLAQHLALQGTARHCRPLPGTSRLGTASSSARFTLMEHHAAAADAMQRVPRPTERAPKLKRPDIRNVPHVVVRQPACQPRFGHASPQYQAVLHSGQTSKSFIWPITSHSVSLPISSQSTTPVKTSGGTSCPSMNSDDVATPAAFPTCLISRA